MIEHVIEFPPGKHWGNELRAHMTKKIMICRFSYGNVGHNSEPVLKWKIKIKSSQFQMFFLSKFVSLQRNNVCSMNARFHFEDMIFYANANEHIWPPTHRHLTHTQIHTHRMVLRPDLANWMEWLSRLTCIKSIVNVSILAGTSSKPLQKNRSKLSITTHKKPKWYMISRCA